MTCTDLKISGHMAGTGNDRALLHARELTGYAIARALTRPACPSYNLRRLPKLGGLLRLAGCGNIARGLEYLSRRLNEVLALLGV